MPEAFELIIHDPKGISEFKPMDTLGSVFFFCSFSGFPFFGFGPDGFLLLLNEWGLGVLSVCCLFGREVQSGEDGWLFIGVMS